MSSIDDNSISKGFDDTVVPDDELDESVYEKVNVDDDDVEGGDDDDSNDAHDNQQVQEVVPLLDNDTKMVTENDSKQTKEPPPGPVDETMGINDNGDIKPTGEGIGPGSGEMLRYAILRRSKLFGDLFVCMS